MHWMVKSEELIGRARVPIHRRCGICQTPALSPYLPYHTYSYIQLYHTLYMRSTLPVVKTLDSKMFLTIICEECHTMPYHINTTSAATHAIPPLLGPSHTHTLPFPSHALSQHIQWWHYVVNRDMYHLLVLWHQKWTNIVKTCIARKA